MPKPIQPPTRRKTDGTPYLHSSKTVAALTELLDLTEPDLLERCRISDSSINGFVSGECLAYLMRKHNGAREVKEELFFLLIERARLTVRAKAIAYGDLIAENLGEAVRYSLTKVLIAELEVPNPKLDVLEVCFGLAVEWRYVSELRKILSKDAKTGPIEADAETGLVAGDNLNVFKDSGTDDLEFLVRKENLQRLPQEVARLPQLQQVVIKARLEGLCFSSNDPTKHSISKMTGKSDKHLRNQCELAKATLTKRLGD